MEVISVQINDVLLRWRPRRQDGRTVWLVSPYTRSHSRWRLTAAGQFLSDLPFRTPASELVTRAHRIIQFIQLAAQRRGGLYSVQFAALAVGIRQLLDSHETVSSVEQFTDNYLTALETPRGSRSTKPGNR